MKYFAFFLTLYSGTVIANCDPMAIAGNSNWANPGSSNINLVTTSDPTLLIGVDCDDKILVNNITNGTSASQQDDFSYFMPDMTRLFSNGRFDFEFSIDFADVLSVIGTGNKIDFLELMVEPEHGPNTTQHKIAKIRIKKKPTEFGTNHESPGWKVHFIWSDLPDSNGDIATNIEDHFWLPEDVSNGLLHFHVSWASRSSLGGTTYINVTSDMRNDSGSHVLLNTSDTIDDVPTNDDLSFSKTFQSPYLHPGYKIAETRLGIIRHDHGVNNGDGFTFYRPLVFD